MVDDDPSTEVEAKMVRCEGAPGKAHALVEIAVDPRLVPACPVCGRRLRAPAPVTKIDPAAWPKDG